MTSNYIVEKNANDFHEGFIVSVKAKNSYNQNIMCTLVDNSSEVNEISYAWRACHPESKFAFPGHIFECSIDEVVEIAKNASPLNEDVIIDINTLQIDEYTISTVVKKNLKRVNL